MSTIRIENLILSNPLNETYGGTSQTSYNTGDILYTTGTNTLGKLPIGTTGTFLSSNGVVPAWNSLPVTPVTTESLNVTTVSQAITPDLDYTFLNNTGNSLGTYQWTARASSIALDSSDTITSDSTGVYISGF